MRVKFPIIVHVGIYINFYLMSNGLLAQKLPEISKCWPGEIQILLSAKRDSIIKRIKSFDQRVDKFNSNCTGKSIIDNATIAYCQSESLSIDNEDTAIEVEKSAFDTLIRNAEKKYINTNTSLVDGCNVPSILPEKINNAISKSFETAPEGVIDRVRKGYQAILTKDWVLAKAWFEDALLRDQSNVCIKRLIDLSIFTIEANKKTKISQSGKLSYKQLTNTEKNVLNVWIQRARENVKNNVVKDATSDLPASAMEKVRKYVYGLSDLAREKLFFPEEFMVDILMHDMIK